MGRRPVRHRDLEERDAGEHGAQRGIGAEEIAQFDRVHVAEVVVGVDTPTVDQAVERRAVIAPQPAADGVHLERVDPDPLDQVAVDERVDPLDDTAVGRVERVVDVEQEKVTRHRVRR